MLRMRSTFAALVVACSVSGTGAAVAGESCGGHAAACEAICTPARIARYYPDNPDRCSASCSPRLRQCLRTGIWVHLEDAYPGWREPAGLF